MFRNRNVATHQFSMVPRADVPRSGFPLAHGHKTTFDSGWLVPMYVDEVLPGDTFSITANIFARMATPLFPIMDNLYLDTFFFFVPTRLIWGNFEKFMGQQDAPGDSTSYLIPQAGILGGWAVGSLADHFGLPTVGQVDAGGTVLHSSLPLRAYNKIWNDWFRDENLQTPADVPMGDGPDGSLSFVLRKRGKRHDYFTSCLPWTQKGTAVPLPLGDRARVMTQSTEWDTTGNQPLKWKTTTGTSLGSLQDIVMNASNQTANGSATGLAAGGSLIVPSNMFADLSTATAATINQLRQAFQIQKLLERDARGGTRYTESVRAHFGVVSPDARLQRPEYLGGGSTPITVNPVAQTSGDTAGSNTPQGNLAAFANVFAKNGFTQSFTEHGYIIGLMSVRADLTYQQGMRKMWSRRTRFDFYYPVFQALGEQAVLNKEIYAKGTSQDELVFGYQERWAEYRYHPSMVTGLMRSTSAGTVDVWHLAQNFTALPTLNNTFIEDTPPVQRVVAVGNAAAGQEFVADMYFTGKMVRPLPMYSVPGMIDHF